MRRWAWLSLALAPTPAVAHEVGGSGWNFAPWLVIALFGTLALFMIGYRRLAGRTSSGAQGRRALLFAAGWLVLAGATLSPLHGASARSFTLHMLEHELLMLVAAPLMVLGRPLGPMLWALPPSLRRGLAGPMRWTPGAQVWTAVAGPVGSTLLQAAVLWLWHLPSLFDRALQSEAWHTAQHLSFVISALLFWRAMLEAGRRRGGLGLAAICLFATSVIAGALGALMALSESPWYARYADLGLAPFGLSPAEDQQLAGLLMWIPGGLVHAAAALALMARLTLGSSFAAASTGTRNHRTRA